MKIEITLTGSRGSWTADMTSPSRPGSPPVGTGSTKTNAILALFTRILHGDVAFLRPEAGEQTFLFVNGKPWQDSRGASRR